MKKRGYTSYRRRRRRKSAIIIAVIIGAGVLIAAGVFLLCRGDAKREVSLAQTIKQEIRQQSTKNWEIIHGENEYTVMLEEGIEHAEDPPLPSLPEERTANIKINPSLLRGMEEHKDEKVLFDIEIFVGHSWEQEAKWIDLYIANETAYDDPIFAYRNEVYHKWHEEVYVPLDREMTAAEERGEEHAQGWWKHDSEQLFQEYWEETQSEEIQQEYAQAQAEAYRRRDAFFDYEMSSEYSVQRTEDTQAECARLKKLGYDLQSRVPGWANYECYLVGYLTYDQLNDFKKNDLLTGYEIRWREEF